MNLLELIGLNLLEHVKSAKRETKVRFRVFTSSITCLFALKKFTNRVKKRTRKCDARAAEKGAKNVDKRPLYFEFFNELVIEAGEPCKRSLQPRIDFKSVVITLVNPSNCFLTMLEGSERHGVGNTFKNYYKLSRFVEAHGRRYSSAVEYATSFLDSAHSRNNPR